MTIREQIEKIIDDNTCGYYDDLTKATNEICKLLKEMGISPDTELSGKLPEEPNETTLKAIAELDGELEDAKI